jgi:hypothetical protein
LAVNALALAVPFGDNGVTNNISIEKGGSHGMSELQTLDQQHGSASMLALR